MKKVAIFVAIILAFMSTAGCMNALLVSALSNGQDNNASNIHPDENGVISISADNGVIALDEGLSTVRYDGDYGFDAFLSQGGASSDRGVLEFFTSYLGTGSQGLQFSGDTFGCSTIAVQNTEGGYLFGRNFDWQACDAMIVVAHPENGYDSISTVNMDFIHQGTGFMSLFLSDEILTLAAMYAPLDGMNEKGLCVSVNMIQDAATIQQETDKPDITTTTAIRLLLDKAANVTEALELLESYDLHASMNYMIHFAIADSSGNSVAVEYVDNAMIVTQTPVLTNFYLAQGDKQNIGTAQSHTRFELLTDALAQGPAMTYEKLRDVLDSVSKDNFGSFESTEWSVIFDQAALTACYYHRENYAQGYTLALKESD